MANETTKEKAYEKLSKSEQMVIDIVLKTSKTAQDFGARGGYRRAFLGTPSPGRDTAGPTISDSL